MPNKEQFKKWALHWEKTLEIVGEMLNEVRKETEQNLAEAKTPAEFARVMQQGFDLVAPISSIGALIQENGLHVSEDEDDEERNGKNHFGFSEN